MSEMSSIAGDQRLYRYGEIYWVEFDEETVGTELKGDHPGLIISDN